MSEATRPARRKLPPAQPPLPEMMTVEEAAEALRVSGRTVRGMIRRNELPGKRCGKEYRIPKPALEAFLSSLHQ